MWLLLFACRNPEMPADTEVPEDTDVAERFVLSVSSYFGDTIGVWDPATGESLGTVTGLDGPQTVEAGPDGDWIACSEMHNTIVRIDPATLAMKDALVADNPATEADETGGLRNPDGAAFGPDGRLYVSSFESDEVLRYEADGTFVDIFVAARAGGLNGPDIGIGFDPQGNLVVPGYYSDRIHRYDADGEPLADLIGDDQGLDSPREVRWDAAGVAYVSGFDSDGVLRVDTTGVVTPFVTLDGAAGLALDEAAGVMYVASGADSTVRRFDLATGADLGLLIPAGTLDGATAVELLPRP